MANVQEIQSMRLGSFNSLWLSLKIKKKEGNIKNQFKLEGFKLKGIYIQKDGSMFWVCGLVIWNDK